MRDLIWTAALAATLALGGCKKKQDDTGGAARAMQKTIEPVNTEPADNTKPADLSTANADLDAAIANLTGAEAEYEGAIRERLRKLDVKLDALGAKADAKSKQAMVEIKARRDQLASKAGTAKNHVTVDWQVFKKEVAETLDELDRDVDNAMK